MNNVTEGKLSFRQATEMESRDYLYHPETDDTDWLAEIFSIDAIRIPYAFELCQGQAAVQELGSVSVPEGRLLAWPNVLQHRMEPFELLDKDRPGHRWFVMLSLVDPNYRICSTQNVPPQRHDWLAEAAASESKLPREVLSQIMESTRNWSMGLEEAKKLRLALKAERRMAEKALETVTGKTWFSGYDYE